MLAATTEGVTDLGDAPALPRTDARTAQALNRLYSATAPADHTVRDARWVLRWDFDAAGAATPQRDGYRFKLGNHTGHLGLDALAVSALLGERRSDLLPGELRCVLLADVLHPLAEALEKRSRLRFEWVPVQDEVAVDAQRAAFFSADTAQGRFGGFVQFDDHDALDTLVSVCRPKAGQPARSLEWLRVPLPFCLGVTHMSLREIGSIRAGDIVGIEEWGSAGSALRVTADVGGARGVQLVGLAEGDRIIIQQSKDEAMNRDTPASSTASDDNDAASLPLDRLDALEVTLRFEVGDLAVSLGELKSIRPGHVFDLARPLNRSLVRILAHGNVLGKGHLVAIGDRLGVRISEFAPSEL